MGLTPSSDGEAEHRLCMMLNMKRMGERDAAPSLSLGYIPRINNTITHSLMH